MATIQQVLDRVAEVLNDAGNVRYTAPNCIAYYNEALLMARRVRPDLFIYTYAAAPTQATVAGDTFGLPESYIEAVSDYVAGRAELRDDEFATDGRAMTLMARWVKMLTDGV